MWGWRYGLCGGGGAPPPDLPSLRQWRYAHSLDVPDARTALDLSVEAVLCRPSRLSQTGGPRSRMESSLRERSPVPSDARAAALVSRLAAKVPAAPRPVAVHLGVW